MKVCSSSSRCSRHPAHLLFQARPKPIVITRNQLHFTVVPAAQPPAAQSHKGGAPAGAVSRALMIRASSLLRACAHVLNVTRPEACGSISCQSTDTTSVETAGFTILQNSVNWRLARKPLLLTSTDLKASRTGFSEASCPRSCCISRNCTANTCVRPGSSSRLTTLLPAVQIACS